MRIGVDGAVIVADVGGEQQPPQAGLVTHVVKVRVADVDARFQRARSLVHPCLVDGREAVDASEGPPGHRPARLTLRRPA